jgi:predicted Zn-dependent protease
MGGDWGGEMIITATPYALSLRQWRLAVLLAAALLSGPTEAQGLLNKLKDRLGPAADAAETIIENRAAFEGFSEQEEVEIATANSRQFEAQAVFFEDPELETYLNRVVQRLAAHAAARPFQYRLRVVNDPAINAFTFGGGYLYVNAGLVARMANEAQLAMVLGHEIAHAAESHVTEGMQADAGINMLGQLAGRAASASGRIDGEVLRQTYHYSMNAAINGHGRRQESEADELGLQYLVKAGYDPREAGRAFEALLQEYGDPSKVKAFFYSSHPRNEERMKRADEWVSKNVASFGPELIVNADEFKSRTHEVAVAVDEQRLPDR